MDLGEFETGKVIQRLRIERQLSIEDVAELIDEDVEFIRELEANMYPDIGLGVFFYLAKVFKMEASELIDEIHKENIDYFNRVNKKYELAKQRDKQRKLVLQKKKTHNFKNKITKHPFKAKINTIENGPTTSIRKLCIKYDIIPK
ncbi:helix-turn-helix domain-containing protein [Neobacillus vireti]|uniref:helix-turn-helix domain-containing protein n=1 Tax=Neobacillus vireti TaxID=220686 RepID=UPI003000F224